MIIESIRVTNFLSHAASEIDLRDAPMWLISGENGSGKSALFDAVEYALYGGHRGGERERQHQADLLVKQGQPRAQIEVVVQLDSERLRIRHEIDARIGNKGGRIDRWDDTIGDWRPINVGAGVQATWDWLQQRVPPHNLFCSAIYLRQNETARFLQGTSTQRLDRFRALIDLSRYTELSHQAQRRAGQLFTQRSELEGRIRELGDISDAELARIDQRIVGIEEEETIRRAEAERASERLEQARRWAGLQAERQRRDVERKELHALLAEEGEIRAAARQVAAWDRDAVALDRYWRAQEQVANSVASVATARGEVAEAERQLGVQQTEFNAARARQHAISDVELPAARGELERAKKRRDGLLLEARIARARASVAYCVADLEGLHGAEQRLVEWTARRDALPTLATLGAARATAAQAREALDQAVDAAEQADAKQRETQAAAEGSRKTADDLADTAAALEREMGQLRAAAERLRGQIAGHERLQGDEAACPVCDQALDASAHEHVREALRSEHERLATIDRDLDDVKAQADDAAEQAREAEDAARRLEKAARAAVVTAAEKKRDLDNAKTQADHADTRLATARETLIRERPIYGDLVDVVTEEWVSVERGHVSDGCENAEAEMSELRSAQSSHALALGILEERRHERSRDAEPIGDQEDAEAIDKLLAHASEEVITLTNRIAALDEEAGQNRASIEEMTSTIARLKERIEAQTRAADDAEQQANLARSEARNLAGTLRPRWDAVLDDISAYQAHQAEIAELRPLAERDDELHEAPGKLAAADAEIARIDKEAAVIAEVDRVPVPDAEAAERRARQDQFSAAEERGKCIAERDDFVHRRQQVDSYAEQVNQLAEQAGVFSELCGLLSDRGQLQVEIATQEQRRIVDEVNQVLDLLGDPLRVQLGDPRRVSTLQQLQDLRIVDMSDPTATPRYFEFLSGGEKFRIALSLALALHRRVGGGAVGTLVIDEGFGALDSERRDTLALQMSAEAGRGVLGLGLAESIIICSHQSEVQRHFPHRWHIVKRDGAASVTRIDLQIDDLASVGLLDAGNSLR